MKESQIASLGCIENQEYMLVSHISYQIIVLCSMQAQHHLQFQLLFNSKSDNSIGSFITVQPPS